MKKTILISGLFAIFTLVSITNVRGVSSIGAGINFGGAYPDGIVSNNYSQSYTAAYGIGINYAYHLNEYFFLLSDLNYEYRPVALNYKFPKSKNGKLVIKQYFVSLDAILRFQIFSCFIDAGAFYAVKGGPGQYNYTGDYHIEGPIRDFDSDVKENFPFGIILGLGKVISISEKSNLEFSIRYKYEITSQYESPDSNWKLRSNTICFNIGINHIL